ncbi:hypothetical protein MNEG_10984 [Monoraphidium neglectum]|uniref:Uncharacterized protein n=1 Tax=Monoraphidium neglectum TaxID=145388 RepID=A0A0D2KMN8_9CHLO|nr:hypothetical protein MNEG_10984 [Monoraphidium neglectum]KIY96978.1 hypothetical protein MNEG_10984 [Monoraphidium neglectum]|eukprot:XP_013895998.1 hypothetical protein MNEG_10984 [Monoraphidium neglectum]
MYDAHARDIMIWQPQQPQPQPQQQQQQQQQLQQQRLRDVGPDAALLLAYHAAQNRSLFAAQCFVETLSLQLAGLQSPGSPKALGPQEVDLLVTWTLVIMLTAQELGVPFTPAQTSGSSGGEGDSGDGDSGGGGGGVTRRHGQASLGLQGFARQALQRYDSEGHNLARVAALQGAVRQQQGNGGGGGGGGFSQAAEVMQQYSRLALLTVEAAAAAGLPINRPVQEPTTVTAPTDYAPALLAGWRPGGGGGGGEPQDEAAAPETAASVEDGGDVRGAAVHLLVAFMGAVLGAPYSLQQFLAAAADAYAAGHSAAELLGALKGDEFLQAGGLLPVAAPGPGTEVDITRQLFARWLSSAYFTFASLGAAFPPAAAAAKPGWAWAGAGDEVEANALAAFVAQTLARVEAEEAEAAAVGAAADVPVEADQLAARISTLHNTPLSPCATLCIARANPEAAEQLQAVSQQIAEEIREKGTKMGRPVPSMVKLPDPSIAETSSALVAWRQQLAVVEGARALVLGQLRQQQADVQ